VSEESYIEKAIKSLSLWPEANSKVKEFSDKTSTQKILPEDISLHWLKILKTPFRALIIGKTGSGKSVLGHFLLEIFRFQKNIFILGFPEDKIKLLPEYINVVNDLTQILPDSLCLIDESYIHYYSRDSMTADKNKLLTEMLALSRQRNISLIFITQSSGLIDKNILTLADYLIFKEINDFQVKFERKETRQFFKKAKEKFDVVEGDKRKWTYIISSSGDFEEFLGNKLPTYWNEEISRAYASFTIWGEKYGRKIKKTGKEKHGKTAEKPGIFL